MLPGLDLEVLPPLPAGTVCSILVPGNPAPVAVRAPLAPPAQSERPLVWLAASPAAPYRSCPATGVRLTASGCIRGSRWGARCSAARRCASAPVARAAAWSCCTRLGTCCGACRLQRRRRRASPRMASRRCRRPPRARRPTRRLRKQMQRLQVRRRSRGRLRIDEQHVALLQSRAVARASCKQWRVGGAASCQSGTQTRRPMRVLQASAQAPLRDKQLRPTRSAC